MTFTSYAQNFEDVMLWRALRHIQQGYYVDVGAQHPIIDSVSKAFYDQGWRGLHVEPSPEYAALLRTMRPDEEVLALALSDVEGSLSFNVIEGTGLSTASKAYADQHEADRGYHSTTITVPVTTLNKVLANRPACDIHWLKIDVEGLEAEVLRGWDPAQYRPWVMVIEATIPNSPQVDYAAWEPILLDGGYVFVYFDGLNRFYVAKEHPELLAAFALPPHVFDDIRLTVHSTMLADVVQVMHAHEQMLLTAQAAVENTQTALKNTQTALKNTQTALKNTQTALNGMTQQYMAITQSRSWRITLPIRLLSLSLRRLAHWAVARISGWHSLKRLLLWVGRKAAPYPKVTRLMAPIYLLIMHKKQRFLNKGSITKDHCGLIAPSAEQLPVRILGIYQQLKQSMDEEKFH